MSRTAERVTHQGMHRNTVFVLIEDKRITFGAESHDNGARAWDAAFGRG